MLENGEEANGAFKQNENEAKTTEIGGHLDKTDDGGSDEEEIEEELDSLEIKPPQAQSTLINSKNNLRNAKYRETTAKDNIQKHSKERPISISYSESRERGNSHRYINSNDDDYDEFPDYCSYLPKPQEGTYEVNKYHYENYGSSKSIHHRGDFSHHHLQDDDILYVHGTNSSHNHKEYYIDDNLQTVSNHKYRHEESVIQDITDSSHNHHHYTLHIHSNHQQSYNHQRSSLSTSTSDEENDNSRIDRKASCPNAKKDSVSLEQDLRTRLLNKRHIYAHDEIYDTKNASSNKSANYKNENNTVNTNTQKISMKMKEEIIELDDDDDDDDDNVDDDNDDNDDDVEDHGDRKKEKVEAVYYSDRNAVHMENNRAKYALDEKDSCTSSKSHCRRQHRHNHKAHKSHHHHHHHHHHQLQHNYQEAYDGKNRHSTSPTTSTGITMIKATSTRDIEKIQNDSGGVDEIRTKSLLSPTAVAANVTAGLSIIKRKATTPIEEDRKEKSKRRKDDRNSYNREEVLDESCSTSSDDVTIIEDDAVTERVSNRSDAEYRSKRKHKKKKKKKKKKKRKKDDQEMLNGKIKKTEKYNSLLNDEELEEDVMVVEGDGTKSNSDFHNSSRKKHKHLKQTDDEGEQHHRLHYLRSHHRHHQGHLHHCCNHHAEQQNQQEQQRYQNSHEDSVKPANKRLVDGYFTKSSSISFSSSSRSMSPTIYKRPSTKLKEGFRRRIKFPSRSNSEDGSISNFSFGSDDFIPAIAEKSLLYDDHDQGRYEHNNVSDSSNHHPTTNAEINRKLNSSPPPNSSKCIRSLMKRHYDGSKSTIQNDDDNDVYADEHEDGKHIIMHRTSSLPNYYPGIQGCRSVEEFQCLNRIEEGTYGVVYRARDKRTQEIVALKRLKMEKEKEGFPITALREINTLLKCQHLNVVTVREIVVGSNLDKIYIVMDFAEHDLKSLMDTMKSRKQSFLPGEIKCLTQQLLCAVAHLHDNWILHRDLKTSNLLLSHKGILKVGDFGLAREYGSPLKKYTSLVVTLYYRAPELLLGAPFYSTPIDIWSVGCIFAEFLQMCPLFTGNSEIDQVNRIFKLLGSPNENIWPGYNNLPAIKNTRANFAVYPISRLKSSFLNRTTEIGVSLLQGLLTYDPKQRLTADAALHHPYFKELPKPIDPSMFPTWPAKSEQIHIRSNATDFGRVGATAKSTKTTATTKSEAAAATVSAAIAAAAAAAAAASVSLSNKPNKVQRNAPDSNSQSGGGKELLSGIITGNKNSAAENGFVLSAGQERNPAESRSAAGDGIGEIDAGDESGFKLQF